MSGTYHFVLYAGRDLDRILVWKRDSLPVTMGAGWSARMQLRDRAGGRLMDTWDSDDGSIELGEDDGTIRLRRDADDTEWIGWKHGVYDLILSTPDGQVLEPLLLGTYDVVRPVTVME